MNWLKQNWFKAIIGVGMLLTGFSFFYNYVILLPQKSETELEQKSNIFDFEPTPTLTPTSIPTREIKNVQPFIPKEDPLVKVERCKTYARQIADKAASEAWIQFIEKHTINGILNCGPQISDNQCIQIGDDLKEYVHRNTYNSEYQLCLSQ